MAKASSDQHHRRLLLWTCAFLTALLVTLAVMHFALWQDYRRIARQGPRPKLTTNPGELRFQGRPGPWGELEYARINIELPDEFAHVDEQKLAPARWFFPGYDAAKLATLWEACGLTPGQREELANPALRAESAEGIIVAPPPPLVLELSNSARAQLYTILAGEARNDFQRWPYVYRNGGFDDWFGKSGLSNETIDLARKLVYPRGRALCFSDLPEALTLVTNDHERQRLLKTLSLNASLLMRVWVTPSTDLDALTDYWIERGRIKDVRPLLESLAKIPGGFRLDVLHLLPPFARKRLNAYPAPPTTPDQPAPDCYWTAFNFFNDPPDDRYFDDAVWRQELAEQFGPVEQPTYGDLVFLVQPDGKPIHCSVYIADDVVFTKNGVNFRQPWILMKMDDMLARYPVRFPVRVVFFHPKQPRE